MNIKRIASVVYSYEYEGRTCVNTLYFILKPGLGINEIEKAIKEYLSKTDEKKKYKRIMSSADHGERLIEITGK